MSSTRLVAVLLAAALAPGCYLSHELGDGAEGGVRGADGGHGADGGPTPAVDECGALIVEAASGCTTFMLPPTGDATCTYPGVGGNTGSSFVVRGPPGVLYSVGMSDADYGIGRADDACDLCFATGSDRGCPSDGCAWYIDDPPTSVRVVVRSADADTPVRVRVCIPPEL